MYCFHSYFYCKKPNSNRHRYFFFYFLFEYFTIAASIVLIKIQLFYNIIITKWFDMIYYVTVTVCNKDNAQCMRVVSS